MGNSLGQYLKNWQQSRQLYKRLTRLSPFLSILVILVVFWWLKLTGITLAGEAFCGQEEHTHSDRCGVSTLQCGQEHVHGETCYVTNFTCGTQEHIHIETCYCNLDADKESAADWEATLADIPVSLSPAERLVAVAESQLDYTESKLNFEVDEAGNRHGYTRYGEWYGNPYGDWSSMFTSFCLRYAGLEEVPVNAGASAMQLSWQEEGRYQTPAEYLPHAGDIVFLDKDQNGVPDATGVIVALNDTGITVIEGDVADAVAMTTYPFVDATVFGYGLTVPQAAPLMMMSASDDGMTSIAKTVTYSNSLFTDTNYFVLYVASGSNYYAFDGNGNAVQIYIDEAGNITADINNPDQLLWSFSPSDGTNSYVICNNATGRYMHAYPNNGTGVTTGGAYPSTLLPHSSGGVQIRSNSEFARLVTSAGNFQMTQNQSLAAVFRFGMVSRCTVWLDGTNGGMMSLGGSVNKAYTAEVGGTVKLPEEWQSPEKYSYKLQGWYDVKNQKYYLPGSEAPVTGNTVFYADWVAGTYDVGVYNSYVADTVSTTEFITTRVFDYNVLFNLMSLSPTVSANAAQHSEQWTLVQNGTVPYQNAETLNFIFSDYDGGGDISYPSNRNSANTSGDVYAGLYNERLRDILFSTDNAHDHATGEGIIGKQYLGTGDHLFRLETDPTDEHYGYYFYDSRRNAASYNQSDQRFYVYDYLERTSDSEKDGGAGEYSDFLPFNSPYANTNDHTVGAYSYAGEDGEYADVTHCQYDAKYSGSGSAVGNVGTNYFFGMSMDLRFYLPDTPGSQDAAGNYGNQDLYGKDMHFKFSGDDDVWVLLDDQLVLDIGGIHGVESGDINFATGVVTVNGQVTGTLSGFGEGEHTLTVYYLERGSSQSNCAIYFNLAPRFALQLQKEDVLTQQKLNGAQFSVFVDRACTEPAQLWNSEQEHDDGTPATNVFTVSEGSTYLWGLSAGKTYYIRETHPPNEAEYSTAYGIICVSLDKRGMASYSVEIIEETDEDGNVIQSSNGFTVHGFRIDEENQQAYIVVTNAQDWVRETTTVQAKKVWNDTEDHTYDSVTVYLTVTDADGTVRRIREIALSEENNWTYMWTSLPKYDRDGVTEIVYGVEEAYYSGYSPSVKKLDKIYVTTTSWAEAMNFEGGRQYILGSPSGYLSAASASADTLTWVDEETAKNSSLALWTATVSGNNVRFTNGEGQILTFRYGNTSSSRYFYLTKSSASYQNLVPVETGSAIRLYCTRTNRNYYMGALNSNSRLSASTSSSSAINFTPMTRYAETTEQEVKDFSFEVTNTPLEEETSLTVTKKWDTGVADQSVYEKLQVTVKLLAGGVDTGRSVTLSLKNGWTDTFLGLPYVDERGEVIEYTVEESWDTGDWTVQYGEVVTLNEGETPTYSTEVTNIYTRGYTYQLPETAGSRGKIIWILGGLIIMIGALVCGYTLRRKQERGPKP